MGGGEITRPSAGWLDMVGEVAGQKPATEGTDTGANALHAHLARRPFPSRFARVSCFARVCYRVSRAFRVSLVFSTQSLPNANNFALGTVGVGGYLLALGVHFAQDVIQFPREGSSTLHPTLFCWRWAGRRWRWI